MNDDIVIGCWWTPNELIARENANYERLRDEWGDDDNQSRPEPGQ